jgi:hypothetical protein
MTMKRHFVTGDAVIPGDDELQLLGGKFAVAGHAEVSDANAGTVVIGALGKFSVELINYINHHSNETQ